MSPEVITAFPEKRWARATKTVGGAELKYGLGWLCSKSIRFTSYIGAMEAATAWITDGVEPQRTLTRRDWPAVSDDQFERAVLELQAGCAQDWRG